MTVSSLQNEVMTICRATRITPVASSTAPQLGFVDIDHDVVIDSLVYKANGTFEATASKLSSDMTIDNNSLRAVFTDDTIDASLVARGYYDNAEIVVSIIDFTDLPATIDDITKATVVLRGNLGQVSTNDLGYEIEARSLESKLNRSVTRVTQPFCPYLFGGSECMLDLPSNSLTNIVRTIATVTNAVEFTLNSDPGVDMPFGIIEFTSGQNMGVAREVRTQTNNTDIVMLEPFPYVPQIGDTVTLTAGCNRTETDCRKYNNFLNFGGFPAGGRYMVGKDFIYSPVVENQD